MKRYKYMTKKTRFFNLQTATATVSTTLVLIVLGVVVFFALAARSVSVYVKENVNFSLLISDDMPEPEIVKLIEDNMGEIIKRNEAHKKQIKAA